MKKIYADDYNILPGREVAAQLNALLAALAADDGQKALVFKKGEYFIDADNAPQPVLHITNTIGDGEWKKGEDPHRNRAAILFDKIKNLTVEGNSALFTVRGQLTNAVMRDCVNLTLKDLSFKAVNPDMHALKVVKKGKSFIDFETDAQSEYEYRNGKYFFVGKDYNTPFCESRFTAYWIGKVPKDNLRSVFRTSHPLRGAISVREKGDRVFRARYIFKPFCEEGDEYYLFDVRRKYQGIFAERCNNLVLDGVKQHFNYGLASVFQDCEDVTVKNCVFAPDAESPKKLASVADFMQVCCCRGKVIVRDNVFCGAGDDCLNVHGIHFPLKNLRGNSAEAVFRHPQTHGFCPFRQGDRVRFVNPLTLLPEDLAAVIGAEQKDEYTLSLTFDKNLSEKHARCVIENATACPDLVFSGNSVDRIITRGVLITTSGSVLVENNDFKNTSMHAVLVSDDAKNWYESGFVQDVEIRNNRFSANKGYYVCVKPENSKFAGFVHSGVKIENNIFASEYSKGLYFKDTGRAEVRGNSYVCGKKIKIIRSEVRSDVKEAGK